MKETKTSFRDYLEKVKFNNTLEITGEKNFNLTKYITDNNINLSDYFKLKIEIKNKHKEENSKVLFQYKSNM